ncbi:heavy-metal-associated domain-containing protein [Helicobacter pametensis]|uniref:heavy-metal-associated domain-containing protein n=1 Tax=Helicobacter pametensis TaxID=95149 RepID=UPI000481C5AE|nr:heavy metal-associated domain-containing protein [Helicobacter pametensis]
MQTLILKIPQMHCNHCIKKIKTFVSEVKGVEEINCNLDSKSVEISFSSPANEESIREAIEDCGFEVC